MRLLLVLRHTASLLCFLCLFCIQAKAEEQHTAVIPAKICILSRLDFSSSLLNMTHRVLEKQMTQHSNFSLQPIRRLRGLSRYASAPVLLENGADLTDLPADYVKTGFYIDLIWGMVASRRIPDLPNVSSISLEEFEKLLSLLQQQSPDLYPWFEGLSSAPNLLSFIISAAAGEPDGVGEKCKSAVKYLSVSMRNKTLNPFSVESDSSMAFNVFQEEDAMLVSMWLPESFLSDELLCRERLGKVKIWPCPLFGMNKFLRIRLYLYVPGETAAIFEPRTDSQADQDRFFDLSYAHFEKWSANCAQEARELLLSGEI